jgi:hypothetical protein
LSPGAGSAQGHEGGDPAATSDRERFSDPSQLLTAALEGEEVSESELEAVDQALESMLLSEDRAARAKGKALQTLEEAQSKLSPDILNALAEKFKGSLTQVRHIDERDQLF